MKNKIYDFSGLVTRNGPNGIFKDKQLVPIVWGHECEDLVSAVSNNELPEETLNILKEHYNRIGINY